MINLFTYMREGAEEGWRQWSLKYNPLKSKHFFFYKNWTNLYQLSSLSFFCGKGIASSFFTNCNFRFCIRIDAVWNETHSPIKAHIFLNMSPLRLVFLEWSCCSIFLTVKRIFFLVFEKLVYMKNKYMLYYQFSVS